VHRHRLRAGSSRLWPDSGQNPIGFAERFRRDRLPAGRPTFAIEASFKFLSSNRHTKMLQRRSIKEQYVACPRCGATMKDVVTIPPLGRAPGLVAYACSRCEYITSELFYPSQA
jgi:ribosomal protein S27AE